jgi:hypothetical protein
MMQVQERGVCRGNVEVVEGEKERTREQSNINIKKFRTGGNTKLTIKAYLSPF